MILALILIAGASVFIGTIITFKYKNVEKLLSFSISLAFSVLLILALFEILPESIELLESNFNIINAIILTLIVALIGICILKIIDRFIPEHKHSSNSKHLEHIAIMTTIALFLHNIIEGMALYTSFLISLSVGLIFVLGVSLHNIALGLSISTSLYESNKSKKHTLLLMSILAISTFVGGLLMFAFNSYLENDLILGIILALTLGMIIYIAIFELMHEVIGTKYRKTSVFGLTTGVLIMILALLI